MQLLKVNSMDFQESGQVESDYESRSDSYTSEKEQEGEKQNQVLDKLVEESSFIIISC